MDSACPRMFDAKHLYTPESLPITFFKSKVPRETVDWVISDWPTRLLHVIEGWGLPLTEHWNLAVPFSLTVNLAGETAIIGAEIDSPGSPLVPGMPADPVSPFCPMGPGSPCGPTGPMMPCLPLFPGDPVIPWSPLFPVLPFCPLRPRFPFSPLGPGRPGGPGAPGEHASPFDWQSCSLPSDNSLLIFSIVSSVLLASVVFFVESSWRLFLSSLFDRCPSTKKGTVLKYCLISDILYHIS